MQHTEPKCMNPNSGKVVNTVLPTVIWNALSESDASWQMKKYYSILSHSLRNKYVLRKLLMFSLAFMWTKLNSLGFSVYFLYNHSLNKLCSFKDKITNWQAWSAQDFFVTCVHGRYEELTLSLKMHLKIILGSNFHALFLGVIFAYQKLTYLMW